MQFIRPRRALRGKSLGGNPASVFVGVTTLGEKNMERPLRRRFCAYNHWQQEKDRKKNPYFTTTQLNFRVKERGSGVKNISQEGTGVYGVGKRGN